MSESAVVSSDTAALFCPEPRGYTLRVDANHATFAAEIDGDVAGTITLATDSKNDLAADRAFKNEIDAIRSHPGALVCEPTKFAFEPTVQSKSLMATLFHVAFVYGSRTYGGTDLVIEVNPRHARFYKGMLGFEKVGPLKINESVAAPAQLMWLKVSRIRDFIAQATLDQSGPDKRSLYPCVFSQAEEDGINSRLPRAGDRQFEQRSRAADELLGSRGL